MIDEVTQAKEYIEKVYEAFNKHCDEVEAETIRRLNEPEAQNEEVRQKILADQKAELDKTLAELKLFLNKKTKEVREKLEEIERRAEEQEADLDKVMQTI